MHVFIILIGVLLIAAWFGAALLSYVYYDALWLWFAELMSDSAGEASGGLGYVIALALFFLLIVPLFGWVFIRRGVTGLRGGGYIHFGSELSWIWRECKRIAFLSFLGRFLIAIIFGALFGVMTIGLAVDMGWEGFPTGPGVFGLATGTVLCLLMMHSLDQH